MNVERITERLGARPFEPFVVYANGIEDSSIYFEDPKFASLHADGQTLIVQQRRASGVDRWTRFVDVAMVSAIAVREGNGGGSE